MRSNKVHIVFVVFTVIIHHSSMLLKFPNADVCQTNPHAFVANVNY